jgi:hypothetical protein
MSKLSLICEIVDKKLNAQVSQAEIKATSAKMVLEPSLMVSFQ